MRRFVLHLVGTIVIVATLVVPSIGRNFSGMTPQFHATPRYVIVYNDVREIGGSRFRDLVVFMEPSAFSEDSLRDVFHLLDVRFAEPKEFNVNLKTSLEDVQTPEEHEGPGYSETTADPKVFKHPYANMRRSEKIDQIWTAIPTTNGWKNNTFILRQSEK